VGHRLRVVRVNLHLMEQGAPLHLMDTPAHIDSKVAILGLEDLLCIRDQIPIQEGHHMELLEGHPTGALEDHPTGALEDHPMEAQGDHLTGAQGDHPMEALEDHPTEPLEGLLLTMDQDILVDHHIIWGQVDTLHIWVQVDLRQADPLMMDLLLLERLGRMVPVLEDLLHIMDLVVHLILDLVAHHILDRADLLPTWVLEGIHILDLEGLLLTWAPVGHLILDQVALLILDLEDRHHTRDQVVHLIQVQQAPLHTWDLEDHLPTWEDHPLVDTWEFPWEACREALHPDTLVDQPDLQDQDLQEYHPKQEDNPMVDHQPTFKNCKTLL